MTTQMTLADFIAKHGITMFVESVDSVPHRDMDEDWNRTANHWRCLVRKGQSRMTIYFSQGSAYVNPPTLADVLNSVALDSAGFENAGDFREWAGEYGYDSDSIKALKTFKQVKRQAEKAKALLGDDAYRELLWQCEQL
jgi:hypothetical protein